MHLAKEVQIFPLPSALAKEVILVLCQTNRLFLLSERILNERCVSDVVTAMLIKKKKPPQSLRMEYGDLNQAFSSYIISTSVQPISPRPTPRCQKGLLSPGFTHKFLLALRLDKKHTFLF